MDPKTADRGGPDARRATSTGERSTPESGRAGGGRPTNPWEPAVGRAAGRGADRGDRREEAVRDASGEAPRTASASIKTEGPAMLRGEDVGELRTTGEHPPWDGLEGTDRHAACVIAAPAGDRRAPG